MANQLSPAEQQEAERLLAICAEHQTRLWETSLDLEQILGCAVDTTRDLLGESIEDILLRDTTI